MAELTCADAAHPACGKRRIVSIDATRGAAMFFVCLSHFAIIYWGPDTGTSPAISTWLTAVSMIATPTFILISGMMLGFLYHTKPADFAVVRARLVDRGLFLLTVGHVLIALAHLPRLPHGEAGLFVFVTDTIAFSIIVGPYLVRVLDARTRLLMGAAVYALAWAVTLAWSPGAVLPHFLKDALVGPYQTNAWNYTFPVVPWFGLYLIGSALGERLGRLYVEGDEGRFERLALKFGSAAIALALALKVAYWGLKPAFVAFSEASVELIYSLTSPWQKLPPSPIYLLLFGGVGLVMLSLIWKAERLGRFKGLLSLAALCGRTSLFLFILQYYVYYVGLFYWSPEPSRWWPIYFIVSLVAMTGAAAMWSRGGHNRYLTLGLDRLPIRLQLPVERWSTRREAASALVRVEK